MWKFTTNPATKVIAAILAVFMAACISDKDEPEFSLGIGSPVPSFSVSLLDGGVFDTASLHSTGIDNALIIFFNTTCGDCQRELPNIQEIYEAITSDADLSQNTRLVCIAREEDAEDILEYWKAHNLTLPVSPQSDRRIYNLFANIGIPRLYVANTASNTITAVWSDNDPITVEGVLNALP